MVFQEENRLDEHPEDEATATDEEPVELLVVVLADARAQHCAVMVEACHAPIATAAMRCSWRPVNPAGLAEFDLCDRTSEAQVDHVFHVTRAFVWDARSVASPSLLSAKRKLRFLEILQDYSMLQGA